MENLFASGSSFVTLDEFEKKLQPFVDEEKGNTTDEVEDDVKEFAWENGSVSVILKTSEDESNEP